MENFNERFNTFFEECVRVNKEYMQREFPNNRLPDFTYSKGKKYIRVIMDSSAFCFVDMSNGDILKPASWKTPAKHSRGNIFARDNGLGALTPFGAVYLK